GMKGLLRRIYGRTSIGPGKQLRTQREVARRVGGATALRIQRARGGMMSVLVSSHTAELKQREKVAEDTLAFHLERPRDFEFRAGQSIDLTLIDPPESDPEGNSR